MPDLNALAARLGNVPHFRGLAQEDLISIVSAGTIRRYEAGETIFLEDEPCAGMFVLLVGRGASVQAGTERQAEYHGGDQAGDHVQ